MGAWAIGRGRQVLEFDGRGVDARAWDGRREQVLADHPTVGVDMGAALCSGIPGRWPRWRREQHYSHFLRTVTYLRPPW